MKVWTFIGSGFFVSLIGGAIWGANYEFKPTAYLVSLVITFAGLLLVIVGWFLKPWQSIKPESKAEFLGKLLLVTVLSLYLFCGVLDYNLVRQINAVVGSPELSGEVPNRITLNNGDIVTLVLNHWSDIHIGGKRFKIDPWSLADLEYHTRHRIKYIGGWRIFIMPPHIVSIEEIN